VIRLFPERGGWLEVVCGPMFSGKSEELIRRLRRAEITVLTVAWIAVFAVMGVLAGAGVSHAYVYGQYPVTVPLIVVGLAWAGIMAARARWRAGGTGLAVAAVGAVGAFAGPAGAWAIAGVGLCAALLGSAVVITWRQHRSLVRP